MILVDTCVLFWLEWDPSRMSSTAAEALGSPNSTVHASAISTFELGLKVRNQQLELPLPVGKWVREVCIRRGIRLLPVDTEIAGLSTELPSIHRDPCDRFLIATALSAGFIFVTPDSNIHRYPNLKVVW